MESKVASLKEGSDSSILEKDAAFTIRTVPVLDTVNETEEEIARDTAEAFTEFTESEYKKLLRKIDIMIVPLMWIAYGVQQAGLSTQATLGLRTDLHLVGNQYALLSTFFYVSYLAFEFPFAWLMQKVPIGKTLGVVMLLWGVDVLCMAWARHWVDLSVMRAIQGALECSISPAFLLIVGSFYTRQEQVLRTMIYASSNAGFGLIMDLIMYRLGKIGGPSPWK
ncbi:hypothetical protein QFC24_005270 [Naganishia onofrii]|uniref:Uncharacterized protein n=1 Tax=Naganishia onofrii TaxID=1851511 RepID=A0ACC2XA90_9TREE|nr:hypothetical protein QFC24_005270 [Naganishia onofrii]